MDSRHLLPIFRTPFCISKQAILILVSATSAAQELICDFLHKISKPLSIIWVTIA